MINPSAKAWIKASQDLNITYIHPFIFKTNDDSQVETTGGLLPNFGGPNGTLLFTRFDSDHVYEAEENSVIDYYSSALNPHSYEPYNRELYIETLIDWGWFGKDSPPSWYKTQ